MIQKIKRYFARYSYLQELAKVSRIRAVVNLDEAKKIAIIYTVYSEETYKKVEAFAQSLKQKDRYIHTLGFVPYKIAPLYIIPTLATDFFTSKDVNWFGKPVNAYVTDFLKRDFDILINLCLEENFTLQYISGLAKAKFKVGISGIRSVEYYDFIIDTKADVSLDDFISEVVHYLKIINTKND